MVFIVRGPGALRLHARNNATGKTLCGREIGPERPGVSRHFQYVSRQVSLGRVLGAPQEMLEVMDHELLQDPRSEASDRTS